MSRSGVAVVCLLVALTLTGPAEAGALRDNAKVQEALHLVDRWLDAEQDYKDIPGLSVAIVHDQELVWSGGYGQANPETGIPATPETIYSICSVSKLFTSVAVMTLYDAGKLRLDDEIADLLPWFDLRQTHEESGPITLARVLSHSAGLPRESDYPYWTGPDYPFPTDPQIRARLGAQGTLYPSADVFQYSNLGLTLAGNVVTEVSGRDYHAYVREEILEPLCMTSTWTEIPLEKRGEEMALGYGRELRDGTRNLMSPFQTRGIAPAAGFASTVEDLAKFASWQFRLLEGGEEILRSSTLKEMQRQHWFDPVTEVTWGLGFANWKNDGTYFVGHGGYCPGYRTSFSLNPKDKIGVIVMVSALDTNPGSLASEIHKLVTPALKSAAGESEEADDEEKAEGGGVDLTPYTGVYRRIEAGHENLILEQGEDLGIVGLPADDPAEDLTKLRHEEGDTFRIVRDNDDLADPVTFIRDDSGRVTAMCRFHNCWPKVE